MEKHKQETNSLLVTLVPASPRKMNEILEYEQRFKDPLLSDNKNNGHSIASTTVSVGWRPFPCSMERDVGSVTL